jgi:hypothetical protein
VSIANPGFDEYSYLFDSPAGDLVPYPFGVAEGNDYRCARIFTPDV